MKGMDLKLTPVVMRRLLHPLSMFGPIASPKSPNEGYNLSPAAHPPPLPIPPTQSIINDTRDITVAVKKFA